MHAYVNFYIQRPCLSGLCWCWIGGHDGFVDAMARAHMSHGCILGYIVVGALGLMIGFVPIAGGAGMPAGHIVTTHVTVVVVVVIFVQVGGMIVGGSH